MVRSGSVSQPLLRNHTLFASVAMGRIWGVCLGEGSPFISLKNAIKPFFASLLMGKGQSDNAKNVFFCATEEM